MIHAPSLSAPNIRHAFFTREGGVSDGIYASLNGGIGSNDAPENVRENRARMAAALGVAPTHLVSCFQIHSPDVIVAAQPWTRENTPRADAIVTRVPGLAVGVGTADCGPILFADAEAGVVGAAHAGWKGALTGSGTTRLAPSALARSPARATAALLPAMTTCPGAFRFAGLTTSPWAASSQAWATFARSSPSTAAIAPAPTGTASCM